MSTIKRWIICYSGFLQDGRYSGIDRIEDTLHRRCHRDDTRVLLKDWADSPRGLADRILHRRDPHEVPLIQVVGYSYGGYTAVLLARELKKRGLPVHDMLLIDPVWRPFNAVPSFLSLRRDWTISIPDNVRTLYSWNQRVDRPSGHRIKLLGKTSHTPHRLNVAHSFMDDQPEVFERVMERIVGDGA